MTSGKFCVGVDFDLNDSKMFGGSLRHRKLNFDDVTVEHDCILPGEFLILLYDCSPKLKIANKFEAPPSVVPSGCNITSLLLTSTIISTKNPSTKKHFQSSDSIYKEITRHVFGNYWYIIHPCSQLQ
jgi:hypothetical protein